MYEFVDQSVAFTINMVLLARTEYVVRDWKKLPVLIFFVLLPCSVALGWMGCCPEEKDDTPAMVETANLSVTIRKT